MLNYYKATVMYDGTGYEGFQRLTDKNKTIQGILEKVLSENIGENIVIRGSGRTDKGVHAKGQLIDFRCETMLDVNCFVVEINKFLPDDIRMVSIEKTDSLFHSRFSTNVKTYEYTIDMRETPNVFTRAYTYHFGKKLNIESMKKAANYLIGEHDFKAFSSKMLDDRGTVRTIYSIDIVNNVQYGEINGDSNYIRTNELIIRVMGNGFLYNMVRIIVGTLIDVGNGEKTPEDVCNILTGLERTRAGKTAQYQGLCLLEVK